MTTLYYVTQEVWILYTIILIISCVGIGYILGRLPNINKEMKQFDYMNKRMQEWIDILYGRNSKNSKTKVEVIDLTEYDQKSL